jgi:hypothetical protein
LSSKWVNIPGRIWLDGIGDSEVPVTFANGTLKFILDPFGSNSPGADNLEQTSKDQTFKLCFDGKKINCSISGKYGDLDLFGFEGTPTLAEKQLRLEKERTSTFANGTLKFILDPFGSNSPGADNLLTRSPLFLGPLIYLSHLTWNISNANGCL